MCLLLLLLLDGSTRKEQRKRKSTYALRRGRPPAPSLLFALVPDDPSEPFCTVLNYSTARSVATSDDDDGWLAFESPRRHTAHIHTVTARRAHLQQGGSRRSSTIPPVPRKPPGPGHGDSVVAMTTKTATALTKRFFCFAFLPPRLAHSLVFPLFI